MRRRQPWWWCHQHDTKLRFLANSNHPNSLLIQVPSFSPKATLRKFFDASALSRSKTSVATPGNHMGYEPLQHQSYLLSPKLPWQDLAHEMMDKREQDLALPAILGSSWLVWNHDIKWPFAVIRTCLTATNKKPGVFQKNGAPLAPCTVAPLSSRFSLAAAGNPSSPLLFGWWSSEWSDGWSFPNCLAMLESSPPQVAQ